MWAVEELVQFALVYKENTILSTKMQLSAKCLLSTLPAAIVATISHLSLFPGYLFVWVCLLFLPSRLISIPGQGM